MHDAKEFESRPQRAVVTPFGDDGAVRDGAAEMLVVHEGVDAPAIRQRARVAQFEERVERGARLIEAIDPIVIAHELGALPRQARAEDQ